MPAVFCSSSQFPVLAPVYVRQVYNNSIDLEIYVIAGEIWRQKVGRKSPCQLFWAGLDCYITIFSTDCLCSSATLSAQYFKFAHMSKLHLHLP